MEALARLHSAVALGCTAQCACEPAVAGISKIFPAEIRRPKPAFNCASSSAQHVHVDPGQLVLAKQSTCLASTLDVTPDPRRRASPVAFDSTAYGRNDTTDFIADPVAGVLEALPYRVENSHHAAPVVALLLI